MEDSVRIDTVAAGGAIRRRPGFSSRFCRLLLLLAILCALVRAEEEDISPQRLALLHGVIALADGRAEVAVPELRQAADAAPEEWRVQTLYGEALLATGKYAQARSPLCRATTLAPMRLEPWLALERLSGLAHDPDLEILALQGLGGIFPDNPTWQQRLAELYRQREMPEAAKVMETAWQRSLPPLVLGYTYTIQQRPAELQELRDLSGQEPPVADVLAALATQEWRAGNRDAAREALRRWTALAPANATAIGNYAHLCLLTGKVEEAVRILQTAAALGDYSLDRSLAAWCIALGRYKEAIEPLKRTLLRTPVDIPLNRMLGMSALVTGDTATAASALRLAWMRGADSQTVALYVAALCADKQTAEAERLLQRACALYPRDATLALQLAALRMAGNHRDDAAQWTETAVEIRPDLPALVLMAGERQLRAGNITRTFTMAYRLRERFPNDVVAVYGAVRLFRLLGNFNEAKLALTRFLGPNITSPLPWTDIMLTMAEGSVAEQRLDEAIGILEEVVRIQPEYREAYVRLGQLREQQGQWAGAVTVYTKALARWRDDEQFALLLANAAAESGDLPQAVTTCRQAAQQTKDAEPWLALANLLTTLGDAAGARECWDAARLLPGGELRALHHLAVAEERAGRNAQASELFTQLTTNLDTARTNRADHWRKLLAARELAPTDPEIDALLLLDADLLDPAALAAHRRALAGGNAPVGDGKAPSGEAPTPDPPRATTPPGAADARGVSTATDKPE